MNYGPASKYYDLFASNIDVNFYKQLSLKYGKKALELGVGTGRVALELARAGVSVWGIDSSGFMLKVARQKLRRERAFIRKHVSLKLGDMRNFKLKETFPFAYIASSTFEHCITDEEQKKCLTNVYNALEENGVFAFDVSQLVSGRPESSWWIDRKTLGTREEIVRTIFSRRNPKTNVVGVNLFFDVYSRGKLKDRYYEYGEARISSKDNIERLLKNVGFRVENVHGDFDKSAYDQRSQRIIFIVRKS